MANVFATKNGNWSDTTVWNTGALPTSADDVFSNNFTVNVNQNITVLSLRSTSGTGITAGGSFDFNTSGVTANITASSPLVPGATNLVTVTATTGTVTLILGGNVEPRAATNDVLILHSGNCNFNITGTNFNGATMQNGTRCINKTSSGLITITGNLNGGNTVSGWNTAQSFVSTNGNTIVVGNVVGGSGSFGNNRAINQSAGTLTVTGNVTGGQGVSINQGILFSGTSLTVTGTVTGGAVAVAIDSTVAVNVVGSVIAGSVAAITSTSNMNIDVTGNITASASSVAISSTNASASVNVAGNLQNTNGRQAVYCQQLFISNSTTTQYRFFTNGGQDRTLYSADTLPGSPATSDVRFGTTYGAGGSLTGTLRVPAASNVLSGVLVDNTVGTYATTPAAIAAEVWAYTTRGLTESPDVPTAEEISTQVWTDQPERLMNVATVQTTGDQIASLT